MKNKNVIHPDCLPMRSPLLFFTALWLLLDRFGIPSWGWGVYWTFAAIFAVVFVTARYKETQEKVLGFGANS